MGYEGVDGSSTRTVLSSVKRERHKSDENPFATEWKQGLTVHDASMLWSEMHIEATLSTGDQPSPRMFAHICCFAKNRHVYVSFSLVFYS